MPEELFPSLGNDNNQYPFATDKVGSAYYAYAKIAWGPDGSAYTVSSGAYALPVIDNNSASAYQELVYLLGGQGSLTETPPASDTASSGINGRLQRIAQRITDLIAIFPTSLGQKTKANSFPVTMASDQDATSITGTVTVSGSMTVAGDVAHDGADSGNPVKVGWKARNALPTAVANGDRVDASADLFGRQMVSTIDPAQQIWKRANRSSSGTTLVWDPTSGKKIALTHLFIGTSGTTAGTVTVWFGANGDTTYTAGTDQPVWEGDLTPTASGTPGSTNVIGAWPIFSNTADNELHFSTSSAINCTIVAYGYEY